MPVKPAGDEAYIVLRHAEPPWSSGNSAEAVLTDKQSMFHYTEQDRPIQAARPEAQLAPDRARSDQALPRCPCICFRLIPASHGIALQP